MQCDPQSNPVFIHNPTSPFSKSVSLQFGRLFTVKCNTPVTAHRFCFNFLIDKRDEENAFHLDVRFDENCVVCNSRKEAVWLREERIYALPVKAGQNFELMVLVEEARYMIAFNGKHFTEFVHRMPVASIDTVLISGDVKVSTYQESMGFPGCKPGPLLFLKEGSLAEYDIGSCLVPGGKINIAGVPTGDIFIIDFQSEESSEDIGLHMSCRVKKGVVVLNSRVGQSWQKEVRPTNLYFSKGHYFHLRISCENGSEIVLILNGCTMTTFPIRHIPALNLKRMLIHGDVDIGFVSL